MKRSSPRYRLLGLVSLAASAFCAPLGAASAVLRVQLGHHFPIYSADFSADGRTIITGGGDRTVRLWDAATGFELHRLEGQSSEVGFVAISTDNQRVLSVSRDPDAKPDDTIHLWDARSGRQIPLERSEVSRIFAARFLPVGREIVACSNDDSVTILDAVTGREIRKLSVSTVGATAMAVSPDGRKIALAGLFGAALVDLDTGKNRTPLEVRGGVGSVAFSRRGDRILVGGGNTTVSLIDAASGRAMRTFEASQAKLRFADAWVTAVGFSPDSAYVIAAVSDGTALLWDANTAREAKIETGSGLLNQLHVATFSPDGHFILTAGDDARARLWDAATHGLARSLGGPAALDAVALSRDGRMLVTGGQDRAAHLWDLTLGREIHTFSRNPGRIESLAFSPDGREILAALADAPTRLWEVSSGRESRDLGNGSQAAAAVFSPDGSMVVTGSLSPPSHIYNPNTGEELRPLDGASAIAAATFSPDNKIIATGHTDGTARLWDAATGRQISRLEGDSHWVNAVAFSPDSLLLLTGGEDGTWRIWDTRDSSELRRLQGNQGTIHSVAFFPDGDSILIGGEDGTARIWNAETATETRRLIGNQAAVTSLAVSTDSRFAVTVSWDGTCRFWDAATGRLLATLVSFENGGWAVVDPEGRYDASDPDSSPGLYWQLGDDIIELKQLKQRFYTPNLLARTLDFNPEALPGVRGLDDLRPAPAVAVTPPAPGQSTATIRLSDRGGGVGRVVIKVNGREIANPAPRAIQPGAAVAVDLSTAALAGSGKNTIEVVAYDGENRVAARGVKAAWEELPEAPQAPPVLHAIVVGVSYFADPSLALAYPANDARAMATALRVGGESLFGAGRVDLTLLTSGGPVEPTKENIRKAFESIHGGPNDVVLVYLSGHGVAGKSGSDLYYYLTAETRTFDPQSDPELWERTTVSSAELREWLSRKQMPLREVLILDTCAAGAAAKEVQNLAGRRDLKADQRRALELLKDATGIHLLMGAAADAPSYEASRFSQGLLTYSLLQGMTGAALDPSGRLDVDAWFHFAWLTVPGLAKGIGGIQQPVFSASGQSFPVGLFRVADRERIPLAKTKPQLLPARVEDDDQNVLRELEAMVRSGLREATMPAKRGPSVDPPLVYLDASVGEVAGAYLTLIRIQPVGGAAHIRVRLVSATDRAETNFDSQTNDPADLAREIVVHCIALAATLKN